MINNFDDKDKNHYPTKEYIRNSLLQEQIGYDINKDTPLEWRESGYGKSDVEIISRDQSWIIKKIISFVFNNKKQIKQIPFIGEFSINVKRKIMNKISSNARILDLSKVMSLEIDDFLNHLYLHLLGRPADIAGLNGFKYAYYSGASKGAIVYMISISQEYVSKAPIDHINSYRKDYWKYRIKNILRRVPVLGQIWMSIETYRRLLRLEIAENDRFKSLSLFLEIANQNIASMNLKVDQLLMGRTLPREIDQNIILMDGLQREINSLQKQLDESVLSMHEKLNQNNKLITNLHEKLDQNATLITGLHEKIDGLGNNNSNISGDKKDSEGGVQDPYGIFISNGLLDEDSYLEKSLENESVNIYDFKSAHPEDGWYFLFEKLFRGSEEEIRKRQTFYIRYAQKCYHDLYPKNKNGYFLDFGSGKGEFLSLLFESNIPGKGVDMNQMNTDYVLKKGLDVFLGDGVAFLEKINDNELFGVTLFQVAEHMDFEAVQKLIQLAYKKIMPGGIIIIETVNPSCAYSMQYFYIDPTHIKPFHPETLRFYSEWVGFNNIKIAYYIPVNPAASKDDTSNYMGYALIGYKLV